MSPFTVPTDEQHKTYIRQRTELVLKALRAEGLAPVYREYLEAILEGVYSRAVLDTISHDLDLIHSHNLVEPDPETEAHENQIPHVP